MYHRVLKDGDDAIKYTQPGMYVTLSSFEKQMSYISENYSVISLDYLMDAWEKGGLDANKRYCVVTFDDGWRDNYDNAFSVMKKYGIPATIFLATSFIGTNRWFWPETIGYIFRNTSNDNLLALLERYVALQGESKCRQDKILKVVGDILRKSASVDDLCLIDEVVEGLKCFRDSDIEEAVSSIYEKLNLSHSMHRITMNWEEVRDMSSQGVTFGSHTCNHRLLTQLTKDNIEKEITESKEVIKEKGLKCVSVFCYPNGYYNKDIEEIVDSCGYTAAVTTSFGIENTEGPEGFNLRRIGVHNDISSTTSLFSFHLSGAWYFANSHRGIKSSKIYTKLNGLG